MTSPVPFQAVQPAPLPEIGWSDILRMWRRRSWLILLAALLGGGIAYGICAAIQPTYETESAILFDRPELGKLDNAADQSQVDSQARASLVRSQAEILRSSKIVRQVIDELGLGKEKMFEATPGWRQRIATLLSPLAARYPGLFPAAGARPGGGQDRLVAEYLKHLTIRQDEDTYVLHVGFRAPDPVLATRIANAHVKAYLGWLRSWRANAVNGTSDWLKQAVDSAHARVMAAEHAVDAFRSKGLLVDPDGRTSLDHGLAQMTSDLAIAQARLVKSEARAKEIRDLQAAGQIAGIAALSDSRTLADLQDKYADISAQVAAMRRRLGARHPAVMAIEAQRGGLQQALQIEIQNLVAGESSQASIDRAAVVNLTAELDKIKHQVLGAETSRAELTTLEGDAATERGVYLALLKKLRSFDKVGELVKADATVLSPALVPGAPSAPRRGLVTAFGFLLAGGLAAGGIAWRESGRDLIRHTEDAVRYSGLPCLAVMPEFGKRLKGGAFDRTQPKFSFFLGEIRSLCAALIRGYAVPGKESISVMVTSSLPGEGKTTFCRELGRFAAQSGVRTLIISVDLKQGVKGAREFRRQVSRLEGDVPLYGVTWPLVSNLLWRGDTRSSIDSWQREFGLVIIDTPPLSAMAESVVLAPVVDATLVLARVDHTPRSLLASVVRQIDKAGGKLAGVVVTFARLDSQRGLVPSDLGYYYAQNRTYHKRLAVARLTDTSKKSLGVSTRV